MVSICCPEMMWGDETALPPLLIVPIRLGTMKDGLTGEHPVPKTGARDTSTGPVCPTRTIAAVTCTPAVVGVKVTLRLLTESLVHLAIQSARDPRPQATCIKITLRLNTELGLPLIDLRGKLLVRAPSPARLF